MSDYKNPKPTVDVIIEINYQESNEKNIVLIKRKNPPYGWALPGGFVDYGESLENAAIREAKEETNLEIDLIRQFHSYSDPSRDKRFHTITTVFIAKANGVPTGKDDALEAKIFNVNELPSEIAFDHKNIILDYISKIY